MPTMVDSTSVEWVRQTALDSAYADYLKNLLLRLTAVDTSARSSVSAMAAHESEIVDLIEREVTAADPRAVVRRVPVNPAIANDAHYVTPWYASTVDGNASAVEQIYAGRCNLVVEVPGGTNQAGGAGASSVVLAANVDTVSTAEDARVDGQRVFGCGVCNKAQVAMLIAQIRALRELEEKTGQSSFARVYCFTIDGSVGGNGALSVVNDPRWAGANVIVHEPTQLRPTSAHVGNVYYRCELSSAGLPDVSSLEMFPFAVLAMEKEGRRFREESSSSAMFTPTHVQTYHGMVGHFGSAPNAVCDRVAFEISTKAKANPERIGMKMTEFLDEAMLGYTNVYGDKTRQVDPITGKPKVAKHFDVKVTPGPEYHLVHLQIFGKAGHVGALSECDSAVTKAAWILAAMLQMSQRFPGVQAFGRLLDENAGADGVNADPRRVPTTMVLQGGQAFSPVHRLEDIKARMTAAVAKGVQKYCAFKQIAYRDAMVQMRFDRQTDEAYAASAEIAPMQAFKAAFTALGEKWSAPVAWESSCDARIYHAKGHPTAMFGAGRLSVVGSPDECVDLTELQKALAISTLATCYSLR